MRSTEEHLAIEGVYHHHNTPPDEDGAAEAGVYAALINFGDDEQPEYLVSIYVQALEDGQLSEFHFDADGARQLAQQLLTAADVLDLIDP